MANIKYDDTSSIRLPSILRDLLKANKFADADKYIEDNFMSCDVNGYYKVRRQYLIDFIADLINNKKYTEAEQITRKYSEVFDDPIKHVIHERLTADHYRKTVKIMNYLKAYEYYHADRHYSQVDSYISIERYLETREKYEKNQLIELILEQFRNFDFTSADEAISYISHRISMIEYNEMRCEYIEKHNTIYSNKIRNLVANGDCIEAENILEKEKVYFTMNHLHEVELEVKRCYHLNNILFLLRKGAFHDADNEYESIKLISNNDYIMLRQSYYSNYLTNLNNDLHNLLSLNDFNEAKLLINNSQLDRSDKYSLENIIINDIKIKTFKDYFMRQFDLNFNNEQLNAIGALDSSILLKARAGSGKTNVITGKTYMLIKFELIPP